MRTALAKSRTSLTLRLPKRLQRSYHGRLQRRQIVCHGIPDDLEIDSLVGMPQLISYATNFPPGLVESHLLRLRPEPECRFADDLQFPFDSSDSHRISSERLKIHT